MRNPHFHVWSPAAQPAGYPDRIVLDDRLHGQASRRRVVDGRADLSVVRQCRWPTSTGSRTRYGSQLHTTPGLGTNYVFLNATKPPFDNRDARRAVAYALDRERSPPRH